MMESERTLPSNYTSPAVDVVALVKLTLSAWKRLTDTDTSDADEVLSVFKAVLEELEILQLAAMSPTT